MVSSLLSLFMAFWIRVIQPFSCIASFGALEFIQKVGFFICEALWHKVLTVDQLKKGGGGGRRGVGCGFLLIDASFTLTKKRQLTIY